MKRFEVGQLVFVKPEYTDGDAVQGNIVTVSPKGQSVTVETTAWKQRTTYKHTKFDLILTTEEHAKREEGRAAHRALVQAEERLRAALRVFDKAAWALAQLGGGRAKGNVGAIDAATARVQAITASLREGRDA